MSGSLFSLSRNCCSLCFLSSLLKLKLLISDSIVNAIHLAQLKRDNVIVCKKLFSGSCEPLSRKNKIYTEENSCDTCCNSEENYNHSITADQIINILGYANNLIRRKTVRTDNGIAVSVSKRSFKEIIDYDTMKSSCNCDNQRNKYYKSRNNVRKNVYALLKGYEFACLCCVCNAYKCSASSVVNSLEKQENGCYYSCCHKDYNTHSGIQAVYCGIFKKERYRLVSGCLICKPRHER